MSERPYWFPVLCDAAYFARLRKDYPEKSHMSDDELHEYFNHGLKYQNLWDHVGDAYSDYEPLADSYLEVLSELNSLVAKLERGAYIKSDLAKAKAVIAKAEGKK